MADATLKNRIYSVNLAHRLFPASMGARYAHQRARKWWHASPKARRDAALQMRFAVGELGLDTEDLARRYMYETLKREEMSYRLWLTTRMPVDGVDVLRRAHDEGRGVIVSFMHHGQFGGVFPSLSRHGFRMHVPMEGWFFNQTLRTYAGIRGRQHRRTVGSRGSIPFPAEKSFDSIRQLLTEGQVVALASDVIGGTEVRVLGRQAAVSSGAARLAEVTGAPIVPVFARPERHLQRLEIGTPIEPTQFDGHSEILQEIFDRHEPAVLAWPEALEHPLKRFGPVTDRDRSEFGYDPDHYFKLFHV